MDNAFATLQNVFDGRHAGQPVAGGDMVFTAFLIACGVLTYLQIGRFISQLSWKAWQAKKETVASFLLFPFHHAFRIVGKSEENLPPVQLFDKESAYCVGTAFTWPIKIIWNFLAIMGIVAWMIISRIALSLIFGPQKLIENVTSFAASKRNRLNTAVTPPPLPPKPRPAGKETWRWADLLPEMMEQHEAERREAERRKRDLSD